MTSDQVRHQPHAEIPPVVRAGDSYRWQSGTTREQVVDWYQETTGRVIETR